MKIMLAIVALSVMTGGQAQTPPAPREPTDILIRHEAGLPAASARGQIEIIDVGHHAMETMLSIVGTRQGPRWHISYACAQSPQCAAGADHRAADYDLSAADSAEIDGILDRLRQGEDPGGLLPSPTIIGGNLLVSIDDRGFRHEYRRVLTWGPMLARLETVMTGPAALPDASR